MNTPTEESRNGQAPHPDLHLDDADVPRTGLRPPFAPTQRFSFFVKHAERWVLGLFVLIGLVSFGVIRGCGTHDDSFAHTPLPEPIAIATGAGVIGANVTAHTDRSTVPMPMSTPPLSTPTLAPGAAVNAGSTPISPQLQTQLQSSADGLHSTSGDAQSYTLPPVRTYAPAVQATPIAGAQTAIVPNPAGLAQGGSPEEIVVSGGVAARSPEAPQAQTVASPVTNARATGTNASASAPRATTAGEIAMQQQSQFAHSGSPPYLASIESQALSQTEVFAGTPIRAMLDTAINTSICGTAFAHIAMPVRASLKPYPIVIPPFSTLVGRYNCDVQPGQNRLQVSWDYIKMPNGTTFPLGGVSASENDGSVGLNASVTDHRGQIYTTTFIASLLDGAQQRLAGGVGAGTVINLGQGAAGNTASAVNQQLVQTTLQQRPVLSVDRGKTFIIQMASTAIMVPYDLTSRSAADGP